MTKRKKILNLIAIGIVTGLISSCMDLPERPPFKVVSSSPKQTYAASVEREFTPEERKQIEDYEKKLKARQATEADEKIYREINLNRPEIITPRSPDCGAANPVSTRR